MVDTPESFRQAAARLRRAVESADYEKAHNALLSLRQALEHSLGEGDAGALTRQTLELLAWARRMTLAGRAHDAARLARLRRLPEGYLAMAGSPGPSVRLEA